MRRAPFGVLVPAVCVILGGTGAAQSSLSDATIAKAESAVVAVDCLAGDRSERRRTTGVVVASDDRRSYVVTEKRSCPRTVYLGGDRPQPYPARVVAVDQAALASKMMALPGTLELIAIERGGVSAATLAKAPPSSGVFVLSYMQSPAGGQPPATIRPRLNGAVLSSASIVENLTAIRGITAGGGVFDAKTGELVGVVSYAYDPVTLDVDRRPEPRIGYNMATTEDVKRLAQFSAEIVRLEPSEARTPLLRSLGDAVFPVMKNTGIAGRTGRWLGGVAFAIGARSDGLLLATALPREAGDDLQVQMRAATGELRAVPVRVVARDPASPLTVLIAADARAPAVRFARSVPGRGVTEFAFDFCSREAGTPIVQCAPRTTPRSPTVYAPPADAVVRMNIPDGWLILHAGGLLDHSNGAPVVDEASGAVVGMSFGSLWAFVAVMMRSEELTERLDKLQLGVHLSLASR
jgi:hypothetical protein